MTPKGLEIASLFEAQRTFLQAFAQSSLATTTYLSGGTALAAFYLHHRSSEDLDFFSDDQIPLAAIEEFLRTVPETTICSTHCLYDRKIFLLTLGQQPLKVEFTRFPFAHLAPLIRVSAGLRVDSILDIYINKLHALADRKEPKDEIDVFFLLRTPGFPSLLEAIERAEQKFGLRGLRYILQSRLLAVASALPATTPPVTVAEVQAAFRTQVEALARSSLEP